MYDVYIERHYLCMCGSIGTLRRCYEFGAVLTPHGWRKYYLCDMCRRLYESAYPIVRRSDNGNEEYQLIPVQHTIGRVEHDPSWWEQLKYIIERWLHK
jgi:hypothetical protein